MIKITLLKLKQNYDIFFNVLEFSKHFINVLMVHLICLGLIFRLNEKDDLVLHYISILKELSTYLIFIIIF